MAAEAVDCDIDCAVHPHCALVLCALSYFAGDIPIGDTITLLMIVVGILFVINSLDSLTRLYSQNLGLTVEALGRSRYILTHAGLLTGLVVLYQFTRLKIE